MTTNLSKTEKRLCFMTLAIILLAMCINLYATFSREFSDNICSMKATARSLEIREQAKKLSQEGKSLEAAKLLINAAGASRIFIPDADASTPNVFEEDALRELTKIGMDKAYREHLHNLYPNYRDAMTSTTASAADIGESNRPTASSQKP